MMKRFEDYMLPFSETIHFGSIFPQEFATFLNDWMRATETIINDQAQTIEALQSKQENLVVQSK